MDVVDPAGRRLGRVVRVQLAAPPVTHPPDSDIIDEMASLVPAPPEMSEASAELDIVGPSPVGHDPAGLPDLPAEVREHLEEVGFIEIEASNLPEPARFIAADHVESVSENNVTVNV